MKDLKVIRIKTNQKPSCIAGSIKMKQPCKIRVVCINPYRPAVSYYDRVFEAEQVEKFEIRLPQSSKEVEVLVWCERGVDNIKSVKLRKLALRQFPACYKKQSTREFIKFAQAISDKLPYLPQGDYYSSGKNRFHIQVLDRIEDNETPARIHNDLGFIQMSKEKMMQNTVAMNMAVLLHEYSHFFENVDQKDEIEADMNGLRMYLGLNYPRLEAHKAFTEVFDHADHPMNRERYDYIMAYERKFKELKHKTCL